MSTVKKPIKNELVLIPTRIVRGQGLIEEILHFCNYKVIIAGGFARWCMSPLDKPAPFTDIDLFLTDQYYRDDVINRLDRLHCSSNNNTTRTYDYYTQDQNFRLQFIYPSNGVAGTRTYGDEKTLGSGFDFTVCQAFIRSHVNGLASKLFIRDETEKKLRVFSTHTPISTFHRAIKYSKLGYKISSKEILKVLYLWDCYPDSSKNKLFNKFAIHNSGEQENVIDDVEESGLY